MNARDWERQLRGEGFSHVYAWQDRPNIFYSDHTHPNLTAHIILEGDMTVTTEGKVQHCKAGDRFDVPAHAVHSARMGPNGCRYLVGEK